MLIRLSTRGNAVSGTTYSPGVAVPATAPAGWMSPPRIPLPGARAPALSAEAVSVAVLSEATLPLAAGFLAGAAGFLAGAAGFLTESPPRSCSTADGL